MKARYLEHLIELLVYATVAGGVVWFLLFLMTGEPHR